MLRALSVSFKLLPELYTCVTILGWSLGWRYWKIVRRATLQPELAMEWARACRLHTITHPADCVEQFHKWADELEKTYNKYMELTKPKELEWIAYDAGYWEAAPVSGVGYFIAVDDAGRWGACAISGTAYKRVFTLKNDLDTLAEAKACCAAHWIAHKPV